ncbi:hypothetical protein [Fluviicola sp.]|jgi:hypothetical protein|uniref:hypothetical protein n=1 Tax=Fluviicola sp. TaxID=1917219 RepID=UPI00282DC9F5|nr:hypothetical protein [Fluviicola sp.]MDR0802140.1 hypothetical protein [Fluviicola sp.]
MKNLFYAWLFLGFVTIGFIGCEKDTPPKTGNVSVLEMKPGISLDEIKGVLSDLNSSEKAPPQWWVKVKKWFNDHTGTHLFQDCENSNPCGPCPGLCLSAGIISGNTNDGDLIDIEDHNNGLRVFGLSLIENTETKEEKVMFIFNKDVNDFTSNGFLYIEKDLYSNDVIKNALGKNSIKFVKGKYYAVQDTKDGYYYAIVDTEMD